jgi:hypothetical protein
MQTQNNITLAVIACIRMIRITKYAIQHQIPTNDKRVNRLLERLLIIEQRNMPDDDEASKRRSFEMLGIVRKQLYDN